MLSTKTVLLTCAVAVSAMASSASFASDCRKVRFHFNNDFKIGKTGVEIKVKRIIIFGNDGAWVENITDKRILPGGNHITSKRKLNRLDSGRNGLFKVIFDHRRAGTGWGSDSYGPISFTCYDGKIITFNIH